MLTILTSFIEDRRRKRFWKIVEERGYLETWKESYQVGFIKGFKEGFKEGSEECQILLHKLIADGRLEDFIRAINDKDYLKQLVDEYDKKAQ